MKDKLGNDWGSPERSVPIKKAEEPKKDFKDKQPEKAKDPIVEEKKEFVKTDDGTCGKSCNLDLCFIMDCTSSMASFIERSKQKINDIMADVKKSYPGSSIRIAIVGYRDFGDPNPLEVFEFNTNVGQAKKFLASLVAQGGNDLPEDMNSAFRSALYELKWESSAKMIVLIADAPCHHKKWNGLKSGDNFPKGVKEDVDWKILISDMVDWKIDFLFLRIQPDTDFMFKKFKETADECGAELLGIMFKQEEGTIAGATAAGTMPMGGLFGAPGGVVGGGPLYIPPVMKRKGCKERDRSETRDAKSLVSDKSEKGKSVKGGKSVDSDDDDYCFFNKGSTRERDKETSCSDPFATAMAEQEYFAKLLSENIKETINKRTGEK